MQASLVFTSLLLLAITFFYSTATSSAQPSPLQSPAASPPTAPPPTSATAPAPGFNTVPLVPASPNGAPTPAIPKTPSIDIVQILRKAKRFSVLVHLLKTTQLINQLNSQLMTSGASGLTIFAPQDTSFSKLKPGFLNSLNNRQKVELLQFHTISSFISLSNFDTMTNPVQTQAGDDSKRLQLNVTTEGGGRVSLTTGAVNATVIGTVYTDNKLAIYDVDKVLLPLDFVLPKAAPAPSPKAESPKSDKTKSVGSENESEGGNDEANNKANNTLESSAASNVSFCAEMMIALVLVFVFLK